MWKMGRFGIHKLKLLFGIVTTLGLILLLPHQEEELPTSLGTTKFNQERFKVSEDKPRGYRTPRIQLDWQNVTGSNYKFGIYSAYSYKNYEQVTIITTTKTELEEKVLCKFHYENGSKFTTALLKPMSDTWDRMYAGTFIQCPIPKSEASMPHSVSVIVENSNVTVGNVVPIQYRSQENFEQPRFQFSVCVMPTYKYDDVFHFIEWLEYYKMMGVEQFTFYNISIGPYTSCVLNSMKELESEVIINVFPWHHYPINDIAKIRSGPCPEAGLSAAQNECLYRHKGLSKYMVFVDFDEFIMARKPENFSQLIKTLDALHGEGKVGEYSFMNGFFYTVRAKDPNRDEVCGELKYVDVFAYYICVNSFLVMFVTREKWFEERNNRSKYIIIPEGVIDVGNHVANVFEPGYNYSIVPTEIAILRHYRIGETGAGEPGRRIAVDRIDAHFGTQLALKIAAKVKHFMEVCHFDLDDMFAGAERRRQIAPTVYGCR